MYSYKKSSSDTAKFHNQNDLPTAAKSNYVDTSAYLHTPNMKSPSRIQSKIQDVRQSIGNMIDEISQKKIQNHNALERVRNVNSEALRQLRAGHEQFDAHGSPKKYSQLYNPRENRNNGVYGGGYNNLNNDGLGISSQFNIGNDGVYAGSGPQFTSLEHQNYELRRLLNEHITTNNELLQRIYHLQAQNSDLRAQLGYPDAKNQLRSTRYNSMNYDETNDFSPNSPSRRNPAISLRLSGDGLARNPYNGINNNPNNINLNYGHGSGIGYNGVGNNYNSIGNYSGFGNNYAGSTNYNSGRNNYNSGLTGNNGHGYNNNSTNYNNINQPLNYNGITNNVGSIPLINSQSWNLTNHETANMMKDLENLKKQNQTLRQNTITLLQRQ